MSTINDSSLQVERGLWYNDGNIILVAERRSFRVHKSVLSQHSKVFQDLFEIAQPDAEDGMTTCPEVPLQDRADDVHMLLQRFYGVNWFGDGNVEWSLEEVARLTRLAHKYQITDLLEQGMARLQAAFSDKLCDFDAYFSAQKGADGKCSVATQWTDAIAVVDLAYATDTLTMLPAALYVCAQLDPYSICHGVVRADGTIASLAQQYQKLCLSGKNALRARHLCKSAQLWEKMESSCILDCKAHALSRILKASVVDCLQSECNDALSDCHIAQYTLSEDVICSRCLKSVKGMIAKYQDALWKELPRYFNLGTWDQLRKSSPVGTASTD
ncbi:hypothetical protein BKA93DRAFT_743330 [Sparassis latifolia]